MVDARSRHTSRELDEPTVLGLSAQAGDCLILGLKAPFVKVSRSARLLGSWRRYQRA
jgi:hypothetical protein